jgi:hypothetical protein
MVRAREMDHEKTWRIRIFTHLSVVGGSDYSAKKSPNSSMPMFLHVVLINNDVGS